MFTALLCLRTHCGARFAYRAGRICRRSLCAESGDFRQAGTRTRRSRTYLVQPVNPKGRGAYPSLGGLRAGILTETPAMLLPFHRAEFSAAKTASGSETPCIRRGAGLHQLSVLDRGTWPNRRTGMVAATAGWNDRRGSLPCNAKVAGSPVAPVLRCSLLISSGNFASSGPRRMMFGSFDARPSNQHCYCLSRFPAPIFCHLAFRVGMFLVPTPAWFPCSVPKVCAAHSLAQLCSSHTWGFERVPLLGYMFAPNGVVHRCRHEVCHWNTSYLELVRQGVCGPRPPRTLLPFRSHYSPSR